MIASTNGMNEIAMLYVVRLCEYLTEAEHVELAILFLDLDNFKPYNDTFGHDAGDIVLVGMANIFKEVTDKKGFVCRYGGDESDKSIDDTIKRADDLMYTVKTNGKGTYAFI